MMVRRLAPIAVLILLAAVLGSIWIGRPSRQSSPEEDVDPEYERFMQMTNDGASEQALELGDSLFEALLEEQPEDPTLVLLRRRLSVAEQIRKHATSGVGPGKSKLLEGIPDVKDLGLLPSTSVDRKAPASPMPPARNMYWSHLPAFTAELTSRDPATQQMRFCDRYYDVRMRGLIMEVGRHILVADPNSSESVCHAIVLPLLYLHGRDDAWDQMEPLLALLSPEMLDVLSSFALLQVERPQAAMAFARYRANVLGKKFRPASWATDAAGMCIANHRPDLAERLLWTIIAETKDQDAGGELRLMVAESYGNCGDYAMAARGCRQIIDDLPDAAAYGRITVTYFGYLAKDGQAEQLITESEPALQDARCAPYLAQILYLRWWALCKVNRRDEAIQIAQQLIGQFARNPCVAPVLLERAIDALAHQEYEKCRELLTRLTTDFPATESAKRAREILIRLNEGGVK